jgi:hypothetical protein
VRWQATQELFGHCPLNLMWGVWWVERTLCPAGPLQMVPAALLH